MPDVATVFWYSALMAIATGLGVIPLIPTKTIPGRLMTLASAFASGLLLTAAFQLVQAGTSENAVITIAGIVVGVALITVGRNWLEKRVSPQISELAKAVMLQAAVIVGVMTIHSFPECIAVGLSLGKGLSFGSLISLVIALHNIPEGLATGLILIPQGVKTWKAALWSVVSSLPQPLMAVPAFLLVTVFEPFLPFGLGLAAGAMIWMIGAEVLPEACGKTSPKGIGAALTAGAVLMLSIQYVIPSGH